MGTQVKQDPPVIQVLQVILARQAQLALLALLVKQVPLERRGQREQLDPLALLDQRDPPVLLVRQVQQVL